MAPKIVWVHRLIDLLASSIADLYHRLLVQAICLTGSDLNSSAKPWGIQEKTTQVVYQEFHEQVKKDELYNALLTLAAIV